MRLAGKTALVTGTSRGLGLEIARLFAAEDARVLCHARTREAAVAAAETVGGEPVWGDLSAQEGVLETAVLHFFLSGDFQQRSQSFGGLTISGLSPADDVAKAGFNVATAQRFSDLLAADFTPTCSACSGKGSPLHKAYDVLTWIDALNGA